MRATVFIEVAVHGILTVVDVVRVCQEFGLSKLCTVGGMICRLSDDFVIICHETFW